MNTRRDHVLCFEMKTRQNHMKTVEANYLLLTAPSSVEGGGGGLSVQRHDMNLRQLVSIIVFQAKKFLNLSNEDLVWKAVILFEL